MYSDGCIFDLLGHCLTAIKNSAPCILLILQYANHNCKEYSRITGYDSDYEILTEPSKSVTYYNFKFS